MEKKKNSGFRMMIAILIAVVFIITDLYVMINLPENFLTIVIITILLLIAIFFAVDAVVSDMNEDRKRREEQYDNIFKSEKASYLLLRKTFDDLSKLVENGNRLQEGSKEEIIHAQKAVAKVSIGRNKENADALMNSNDRIMEKLTILEAVLSENAQPFSAETGGGLQVEEIIENQNKILRELEKLQTAMKEIGEGRSEDAEEEIEEEIHEEMNLSEGDGIEDIIENLDVAEQMTEPEQTLEEDITFSETESEDEPVEKEETSTPDLSDPNKVMTPEEIAALIANL